jgi:hypothetical protein
MPSVVGEMTKGAVFDYVVDAGNVGNVTASRVVVSDADGLLDVSATTAAELGHVSGVTSAIQTQLGTKLTSAGRRGRPYGMRADDPTASEEYFIGYTDVAITITEVGGITDAGTVTAMLVWRARTAPFSGGTNVLSANIVFDTDEQVTAGFADATIPADSVLYLTTSAVASSPTKLQAYVEYTIDA